MIINWRLSVRNAGELVLPLAVTVFIWPAAAEIIGTARVTQLGALVQQQQGQVNLTQFGTLVQQQQGLLQITQFGVNAAQQSGEVRVTQIGALLITRAIPPPPPIGELCPLPTTPDSGGGHGCSAGL